MQRCLLCVWFRYNMCCRADGCIYSNSEIVPDYRDGWRLKEGETETWSSFHGQLEVPKGTFDKIWNDEEGEEK